MIEVWLAFVERSALYTFVFYSMATSMALMFAGGVISLIEGVMHKKTR